ncbi:MAG: hypothetical protein RJB34_1411 [Pseudomonadota bacterium]|jgi:CRP/FNR family cyclic AMP-dependent transcriptional regulator
MKIPAPPDDHNLDLQPLIKLGQSQRFAAGQVVFHEGDIGTSLYVLRQGQVRVVGQSETGKELILNTIGAGQILGEMTLDGGTRSATVVALEDCQCTSIPNRVVHAHMREHPEFALQMLLLVISRARNATQKAKDMALTDVYARLSKTLTLLAGSDEAIAPKITHSTLAQMVGSSREMVSKLMKDLEKGGYVQSAADKLVLCRRLPTRW